MNTSDQAATPEDQPDDPPDEAPRRKKPLPRAELAFYAFFGGVIAVVLDSAANATPYCDKFGRAINKLIPNVVGDLYQTAAGAAFVILIATVLAHAKRLNDRYETMFFGASVLTLLATIVPLADTAKVETPGGGAETESTAPGTPLRGFLDRGGAQPATMTMPGLAQYASVAVAFRGPSAAPWLARPARPVQAVRGANAQALQTLSISSCKPTYYGILGLGSLVNNNLRVCNVGHALAQGSRVRVLSYWKTWPSEYYYAEIEYSHLNRTARGWVQAGWKDRPWGYVKLDAGVRGIPAYRD